MKTNSTPPGDTPLDSIKSPSTDGQDGPPPNSPSISRNPKGQFLPGSVPNPKGRAKGSVNTATAFARELLEEAAPAVARRAIEEAKAGKAVALKLVLERLIPVAPAAHDRRIHLDRLPLDATEPSPDTLAPEALLHAHNRLVEAVAQGELSPHDAHSLSQLLEARRRSWESLTMTRRIHELEQQLAESRHK